MKPVTTGNGRQSHLFSTIVATKGGRLHAHCTDTLDRDQTLIGLIVGPRSVDHYQKTDLIVDFD